MAFNRNSTQTAARDSAPPAPDADSGLDMPPMPVAGIVADSLIADENQLGDMLRCHGLPENLVERLVTLTAAPARTPRLVDRLAIALGAHFHFLPLEEALSTPVLLHGLPGAGSSTLAARFAARFEGHELSVISTDERGTAGTAILAEYLEVLGLPLTIAGKEREIQAAVAAAAGRFVVIDTPGCDSRDRSEAARLQHLVQVAGAQPMLVLSAETGVAEAASIAASAAAIGARRLIVTGLDAARYVGAALAAADTAGLAFVGATVTPHFAFGLRALTPENLARRLISAAVHPDRWRVAPL